MPEAFVVQGRIEWLNQTYRAAHTAGVRAYIAAQPLNPFNVCSRRLCHNAAAIG